MVKRVVEHYLISLPLVGTGSNLHCYLMTAKRSNIEQAASLMLEQAEKLVDGIVIPMFVSTGPLDADYTKRLRDMLSELPGFDESLKTASSFHIAIFMAPPDVDEQLMAIH